MSEFSTYAISYNLRDKTMFLLLTGGAVLEDGDGIDLVQCYNSRTNQWIELKPMLIARSGSAACVLNGHVYIIGKIILSKIF